MARISKSDIASILPKLPTNIQIIFYPFLKIFVRFKIKNVYFPPDITYGCNIEEDTVKERELIFLSLMKRIFRLKMKNPVKCHY